ncbi:ABC-type transporter, integral membrane subunit [Thermodesulfobacterium geofontis OPF15]|uniref:ABC-type transporter, integral membrane subunit n=1 Tax=Thermodesulfobacterium geofontis (strain OPF15) TaxID=795359 RepID=F8C214_THEGP|nr:ABC transporter permease [Thermodesulfobacterium geofontis]AEH22166.1 ABC-type transporter, integral membrane subunit [Thermodesulfobacterium geofontis OPF15]
MITFLLKRFLTLIITLLGITIISFSIIHLAPGGPLSPLTEFNPKITPEYREKLVKMYGLDKPLYIQYLNWLKGIVKLDFGKSFSLDQRPVWDKIKERLPITIFINALSLILILLFSIPLGVYSAVKAGSTFDRITTIITFIGYAMPSFWLAIVLMMIFGVKLQLLPISGLHSTIDYDEMSLLQKVFDWAKHLICPLFVATFGGMAGVLRYVRNSTYEVLKSDFILFARAKGLPEKVIIYKHALRNALLPLITILGLSLPGLIGGSVIFETIFGIPGVGQLMWQAVMARDYPVIMANLFLISLLTLLGNFLADIGYALADPRIRLESK